MWFAKTRDGETIHAERAPDDTTAVRLVTQASATSKPKYYLMDPTEALDLFQSLHDVLGMPPIPAGARNFL